MHTPLPFSVHEHQTISILMCLMSLPRAQPMRWNQSSQGFTLQHVCRSVTLRRPNNQWISLPSQAACHSREDECLVGESCLCKVRSAAPVSAPAANLAPGGPADSIEAPAKQPAAAGLKGRQKDGKKAEEAEVAKKGQEGAKKVKEDAKKGKEGARKGEDAEKRAKEAARKDVLDEVRRKEAAKGQGRWDHDTAAKLPFEMLFTGQEQSSSTCPKCGSMSTM